MTSILGALAGRSIISDITGPANGSCPYMESLSEKAAQPIFGDITFYQFNKYLSGACAIFVTLVIFLLQCLHATHFSRPKEQTKIIRLSHLLPAYTIISWFCIFFPQYYYSITPWLDYVQGICLCSFFLLLLEFIAEDEDQRSLFFAGLDIKSKKDKKSESGRVLDTAAKKLKWYRMKWVLIFQYPIVAIVIGVATDVTEALGKYCDNSFSPKYAHLWLFLARTVTTGAAVGSVILMWTALRKELKHHKTLAKIGAFKMVVGLSFLQNLVFGILTATNNLKTTATLTYADVKVGIPTLITCVEMVPIALFFHFAYSYKPYALDGKHAPIPDAESSVRAKAPVTAYHGGFLGLKAHLMALDPREVFYAFAFAFKMAQSLRSHQEERAGLTQSDSLEPLRADSAYHGSSAFRDYRRAPAAEDEQLPMHAYHARNGSYGQDYQRGGGPPSYGA